MKIIGIEALSKLKSKHRGNQRLVNATDELIAALQDESITSLDRLLTRRRDADKVHNHGFYFFNLHMHRLMLHLDFRKLAATVVWTGTHEEYSATFKNNKNTIEKWLKANHWIN